MHCLVALMSLIAVASSGEMLHFSLIPKRMILDDATRHLKLSEEEVDDLYQGYGTHYVRLDVGAFQTIDFGDVLNEKAYH